MKGVEAVIAIILILMIVIALAALAYTWFSGIFSSLTSTAGTGVTSTTNAMATQFSVENAKGAGTMINVTLRNTGTQNIDLTSVRAYVSDSAATCSNGCAGTLAAGGFATLNVTGAPACTCTSKVCYNGGNVESVSLTIGAGLQQSETVVC
jgi:FlaG/FlaF family flagellin (archaellin)